MLRVREGSNLRPDGLLGRLPRRSAVVHYQLCYGLADPQGLEPWTLRFITPDALTAELGIQMRAPGREPRLRRAIARRCALTPRPRCVSTDERQARHHLPDRPPVRRGSDPDRHRLAVALLDHDARDAARLELPRELAEVHFVAGVQRDGDGAGQDLRVDDRRGLAGGVDRLRDLRPVGEVGADDDVVGYVEVLRTSGIGSRRSKRTPVGLAVNGCSACDDDAHRCRRCQ